MSSGAALQVVLLVVAGPLIPGCKQAASSAPAEIQGRFGATGHVEHVREFQVPRVLGVPLFAGLVSEDSLHREMRRAWTAAGESPVLFEARIGERILSTDAPFDSVRAFYLPFVSQVFMDHAMDDVAEIGRQRMFTGLIETPDGSLVKFTLTRPYFPFTSSRPMDRTFLQIGRVGPRPQP